MNNLKSLSGTHILKSIIVDTLQKVREMVSDNYSYSSDYEVIGKRDNLQTGMEFAS